MVRKLYQDLPNQKCLITERVLQTNGFWAHVDHVPIGMLADDEKILKQIYTID